ncbi:E3 ubiquitin-protein ligase MIB2 isoform X4 [Homo sapiens]|uniref:E3 ubiquitin-protein ligase MIB2 isoform X4 n=1 Tax=Homo sapiens TaxID=9606 RepID=UPI001FB0A8FD|nr:E3 ubiquitin-protein ligase MIB2 isoform X4 [Homo sapiens]XP_054190489.1 E3 ubiquitin-protein ligase MIB2 isoform X4 [Homo sapiens]
MAGALRRGRALGSRPSGPTVSSRRSPQCPVAQEGLGARSRPRVAPRSLARCGPSSRLMVRAGADLLPWSSAPSPSRSPLWQNASAVRFPLPLAQQPRAGLGVGSARDGLGLRAQRRRGASWELWSGHPRGTPAPGRPRAARGQRRWGRRWGRRPGRVGCGARQALWPGLAAAEQSGPVGGLERRDRPTDGLAGGPAPPSGAGGTETSGVGSPARLEASPKVSRHQGCSPGASRRPGGRLDGRTGPEQPRPTWTQTPRRACRWACGWCAAWTGSGASRTAARAAWARWWSLAATAAPRHPTAQWSCSGTRARAPTTAPATRARTTCCCVRHPNIICDCCKKHGLRGMRWKCRVCLDYDLCTQCYMHNKHELAHAFDRYETAHSRPVTLSPRQGLPRIPLRGIFQGAKVVRGPDWEWGSQDGGEGKPGRVVDIRGWDVETGRSVASVTWADGTTNVYRVGHKGKVDLKCVGEAAGGFYYKDHLPRLGKPAELQRRVSADSQPFQHGDKVKCLLDTDVLREMQEGHGGWNPRMAEFIGQTGTVHRITDRGDVRVQFNHETRWTFHPGALTKHHSFWVGDVVRVIGDLDTVKRLQAGHGEWTDDMAPALGRVGKVVKVFGDGNLRVAVAGQRWTFSPSCLVAYRPEEDANLDVAERARENKSSLSVALDKLRAQKSDPEHPGRLVVEVALGNAARALDLLRRRPEQVDTKNQGRTALQVAAYLGQVELIRLLLQARAGVDLPDDEGNTALHYAALGNQPEATRVLLSAGCRADAINSTQSTALHVAVQRGFLEVVRALCERGCDVNLPDAHSDTPLHSAISAGTGASGIVEVLTEVPNIDVTATNSQGFTLLHHASLKGHALAVRKILARARQLVDAKKEDGFTALHLAALNNHREVAQILIREGRCDVNVRNRKLQSPLHLAVQQAHVGLVPLLVDAGCSVNAEDEEGDTALHVALQRHQLLPLVADGAGGDPGPLQLLSRLQASGLPGSAELTVGAAVACFLALEGADVSYTNHRGRSPLDLAAEGRVLKALQGCAQRFRERQAGGGAAPGPRQTLGTPNTVTNLHVGAAPGPEAAECLVCSELALLVLFSPCQHRTVCEECARRMKKCIRCQVVVSKKLRPDGSEVASAAPAPGPPRQLVEELQSRYRQMEERITCPICIDSHIRLVFQCGHGACAPCGSALSACPICRQPIRDRIQIFV